MCNGKPKILVVGSFVLDQFAVTDVFPEEGQTVLGTYFKTAPGGKGANQAVQIAHLGADVTIVGKVGDDSNGRSLLKACADAGVDIGHVVVDPACPSGCAVVILQNICDGDVRNRIIVLPGTNMRLVSDDVAFLKEGMKQYDMVLMQLEIPMEVNELVAQYAYEAGVPVMLNPAPSADIPDSLFQKLAYISPNETEAAGLTHMSNLRKAGTIDMGACTTCADKLIEKGAKNVLITLGDCGVLFKNRNEFFLKPCAENVSVVDPTAAGDSFVGAFCFAKCMGMQDDDALIFANHTAAITVTGMGAMPSLPSLEDVKAFLHTKGYSFEKMIQGGNRG